MCLRQEAVIEIDTFDPDAALLHSDEDISCKMSPLSSRSMGQPRGLDPGTGFLQCRGWKAIIGKEHRYYVFGCTLVGAQHCKLMLLATVLLNGERAFQDGFFEIKRMNRGERYHQRLAKSRGREEEERIIGYHKPRWERYALLSPRASSAQVPVPKQFYASLDLRLGQRLSE